MLFELKKLIGYWLMPLPFALLLIILGVILAKFTKRRKCGRGLAAFGALWLITCSNSGVGTWLVRGLEDQYPSQPTILTASPLLAVANAQPRSAPNADPTPTLPPTTAETIRPDLNVAATALFSTTPSPTLPPALARCQFVAVLGGGHTYRADRSTNNQLSPSALSRIVEGVRIVRQLPEARLVVSGPADPNRPAEPSHAHTLALVAISLGVERERIVEIDDARDTEEETAKIARIANGAPVALVTSAWHMPRAMGLSKRQAIDVLACPSDYAAREPDLDAKDFCYWTLSGLERSTRAVYEFIGLTWSKARGKL